MLVMVDCAFAHFETFFTRFCLRNSIVYKSVLETNFVAKFYIYS